MEPAPSKTILITGASRGIGKAAALKFAQHGWQIAITCIQNTEKLLQVKNEIQALGSPCLAYTGNMGDFDSCRRLFQQIQIQLGPVDALVNNAGISRIGLLQDMSISEWNQIIESDLTSVFCCCRLALPEMIRRRSGRIVNISSVWGVCGASCEAAYSAAKGGVNALTKALAKELAPSNIQVNAIACGAIETEMNQWMEPSEKKALLEEIPAGRMGQPSEVAELIFQLITGNSYLTGQIINLDGGWI
ncbi:MAG: 3-oxoacyl-ACP reductase FabG [Lachnospiraceae bacterium]|jgi:3-oxoacyl-[acyl-carrier protein] reductase|nr:3-oxoacyl-ACP reductase FabG [Lachnospiraceae bacterium]